MPTRTSPPSGADNSGLASPAECGGLPSCADQADLPAAVLATERAIATPSAPRQKWRDRARARALERTDEGQRAVFDAMSTAIISKSGALLDIDPSNKSIELPTTVQAHSKALSLRGG